MDEHCSCCGKDVSSAREKKQRRLLSSCTLQTVLQTLSTFICKLQRNQNFLEDVSNGFICRPCVRLIERYHEVSVLKVLPGLRRGRSTSDITAHPDEPGPDSAQLSSQASSLASQPTPTISSSASSPVQTTNTESPALMVTIPFRSTT